jgi:putative transposase
VNSTYFITACTYRKRAILQSSRLAELLTDVLQSYRERGDYLLHEYVIMPDHLHALLTPAATLEKCMSLIKGGFSYRAKREAGFTGEIWQQRYYDRRIRDVTEYQSMRHYLLMNPVRRHLVPVPEEYRACSINTLLDLPPQCLKAPHPAPLPRA